MHKKNEKIFFCVDYCILNAVIEKNSNLILRMNKCIDLLNKATVLFSLEANSGYLPVKIMDNGKNLTATISYHKIKRLITKHFEVCNASKTLQLTRYVILSRVMWQTVFIFLDNNVVSAWHQNRTTNTLAKFYFYLIAPVQPLPADTIRGLKLRTDITKLRSFLELCNILRQLVLNFVHVASPQN